MSHFFALLRAPFDRLGMVARLVVISLVCLVLAVASVETWTLRAAETALTAAAQLQLETNLALFRELLKPLGSDWRMNDGQLSLGGQPLAGRNDIVDALHHVGSGVATVFAGDQRVATNIVGPDGQRAIGTRLAAGPAYDAIFKEHRRYQGIVPILGVPYVTIYDPIRAADGSVIGILLVGIPTAELYAPITALQRSALIGGVVLAVLAGLANWLALRGTLRPLVRLAGVTRALAADDLTVSVPGTARHDQIGDLSRALVVLRDGTALARRRQAEESAQREAAELARGESLRAMARQVESQATTAVDQVAEGMAHVTEAADAMVRSTSTVSTESELVATAADSAQTQTQSIAAAVEQLSASVHEISGQVSGAAAATRRAVAEGEASSQAIGALSDTVGKIGEITQMIAGIAAKTNLLALNATIEAARAGEAGKGFAVVAGEVKTLATQTARATEDITRQVGAVRAATQEAVRRVGGIATIVAEVDSAAAAIAAAVEQQATTTQDIARTVAGTAQGTAEVSRRISAVSAEATVTGARANEVRAGATSTAAAVIALRRDLVKAIRDSAPEVNRRGSPRYQMPQPAWLVLPTGEPGGVAVQLLDISESGAAVSPPPGGMPRGRVRLRIPELLPDTLAADIVAQETDRLRLRLAPEPGQLAGLSEALRQVAAHRAVRVSASL